MKRAVIGGFFAVAGMLGNLGVLIAAGNNMTDTWSTPPGRFLTSVHELGLTFIHGLSWTMLAIGLIIMAWVYIKKNE